MNTPFQHPVRVRSDGRIEPCDHADPKKIGYQIVTDDDRTDVALDPTSHVIRLPDRDGVVREVVTKVRVDINTVIELAEHPPAMSMVTIESIYRDVEFAIARHLRVDEYDAVDEAAHAAVKAVFDWLERRGFRQAVDELQNAAMNYDRIPDYEFGHIVNRARAKLLGFVGLTDIPGGSHERTDQGW